MKNSNLVMYDISVTYIALAYLRPGCRVCRPDRTLAAGFPSLPSSAESASYGTTPTRRTGRLSGNYDSAI